MSKRFAIFLWTEKNRYSLGDRYVERVYKQRAAAERLADALNGLSSTRDAGEGRGAVVREVTQYFS